MRGIAAHPRTASPRFVDLPEPRAGGDGQVLCRTLELGICGTDREILESQRPITPAGEAHLILGHECLARVEETTDAAELEVGDLVVPLVRRATQQSSVRVDLLAFGQYTERGIVAEHGFSVPWWVDRPEYLLRVEPELAPFAVLTEPLSVAEKGINEALLLQQARAGDQTWRDPPPRVLVTGMGPIGFSAVLASRVRGWPTTLFGRDQPDSRRAQLAVDFGADYMSAEEADFELADVEAEGYDLILECTGSDEVMILAARSLASRGVMVWLGSSRRPKAVPHNLAGLMRDGVVRNHIHLGSVNAAPRDFHMALAHLEQMLAGQADLLERLITDRVGPDEALWHFENRVPQGIKVVVVYEV